MFRTATRTCSPRASGAFAGGHRARLRGLLLSSAAREVSPVRLPPCIIYCAVGECSSECVGPSFGRHPSGFVLGPRGAAYSWKRGGRNPRAHRPALAATGIDEPSRPAFAPHPSSSGAPTPPRRRDVISSHASMRRETATWSTGPPRPASSLVLAAAGAVHGPRLVLRLDEIASECRDGPSRAPHPACALCRRWPSAVLGFAAWRLCDGKWSRRAVPSSGSSRSPRGGTTRAS